MLTTYLLLLAAILGIFIAVYHFATKRWAASRASEET